VCSSDLVEEREGDDPHDIHHIIVSGPGLSDNLILDRILDDNRILFVSSGSSPQGYVVPSSSTAVSENSEYVFYLYDSSNALMNSDGYRFILKRGNVDSQKLLSSKSALFCNFNEPYQTRLNTYTGGGASLETSWSTPDFMSVREVDYVYVPKNDNTLTLLKRKIFSGTGSLYTTYIMENIDKIDIYTRCTDIYGRMFDTFLSMNVHAAEAQAKDIIYYGEESSYPYRIF
jgi:hypothetical protein